MKNTICTILLCLVLSVNSVLGQDVVVSGNAHSYAGMDLKFMQYSDFITHTEEVLVVCHVGENGDFRLTLPLTETTFIFTYIGVYRAYLYVEPGMHYNVILPEYEERSAAEQLNPYFQYMDIHLGLSSYAENDLNLLIMMFDDAYNPYYNKHVNNAFNIPDIAMLESDITNIELPFRIYENEYFSNYRHYVYGLLKMFAQQQRVQSLSDEYFNNLPVLYNHPIYGELFNQVYEKYFVFYGRTEIGKQIYNDINQLGSYDSLLNTLSESNNFSNDTLRELVVLKELHDEYYGDQFSRGALLNILDTLMQKTEIAEHKTIAQQIRDKITRLQAGFDPPPFELEDSDSNLVMLSDFYGTYVYLNFCTLQSYTCLNEFNMLADLNKRHRDRIAIVTVTTDPAEEDFRQFRKKYNYDWIFIHYDKDPEILKEYDIRAFPTYFLIGPDGKLILSPAPSPTENFESRFIEILKGRGEL